MLVKDTLFNLIGMIFRAKYPLMAEKEVRNLLNNMQRSGGFIEDDIWPKVVDKMYEERDKNLICSMIEA